MMNQFKDGKFFFFHLAVSVVVLVIAMLMQSRLAPNFSLLVGGTVLGLINVKIFSVLVASVLGGTRSKTALLCLGLGKISIFFVLVLFLSTLSDRDLYSGLAGFFTFIPAACAYALFGQNKE